MKISYKKLVRDGKTAVLIAPGYGAGWSTWNTNTGGLSEALLFDKDIIELVEAEKNSIEIIAFISEKYEIAEDDYVCLLGVDDLHIVWITQGTLFRVDGYGGSESIVEFDRLDYIIA